MDKKRVIYLLIIITSFVIVINSSLIIHNITVQRNVKTGNSNSTTIGGILTNISEKTEYNDYTETGWVRKRKYRFWHFRRGNGT